MLIELKHTFDFTPTPTMKTVISLVLLLLSGSTCISQAEDKPLLRGKGTRQERVLPQRQNERNLKMDKGGMSKYQITGAPSPIEKALDVNARQTASPSTDSRPSESPSVSTSDSPSVSPSARSDSQTESPTVSPVTRGSVGQGQPIPSRSDTPGIPIRVVEGPGFIFTGPLVGVFPSAAPTSEAPSSSLAPSVSAAPSESGSPTTTSAAPSESAAPSGGTDALSSRVKNLIPAEEPIRVTEGPSWIYWGPLVGVDTESSAPTASTRAPAIIRTEGPGFLRPLPPV
jgi:hypothetical protein